MKMVKLRLKRHFASATKGMNRRVDESRKKLDHCQVECEKNSGSADLLKVEQHHLLAFRKLKVH